MVELDNKSTSVRMKAAKHPVSEELMAGPGKNLFNFMADRLRDFMLEHNLLGEEKEHHLGFTFSYPTVQHSLASADLATWTKGFVCSGVADCPAVSFRFVYLHSRRWEPSIS